MASTFQCFFTFTFISTFIFRVIRFKGMACVFLSFAHLFQHILLLVLLPPDGRIELNSQCFVPKLETLWNPFMISSAVLSVTFRFIFCLIFLWSRFYRALLNFLLHPAYKHSELWKQSTMKLSFKLLFFLWTILLQVLVVWGIKQDLN